MPANLAIIGSYPPPYGGVGIHVQRLVPLLDRRGVDYVVYNATGEFDDGRRIRSVLKSRGRWLLRFLFTAKESVIYIMSDRLAVWLIGGLLATLRDKRVMLRLRNAALADWLATSMLRRVLARWALRRMSAVVCVSQLLAKTAEQFGVEPSRIHHAPGFLPPDKAETHREARPGPVWDFIASHSPIIAANGKVDRYANQDLYGLDMLVELATRLRKDHPRLGIVVCFWDHHSQDDAYLQSLIARANSAGVADAILFDTRSGPFVPILAASDLFVRPTNTDGDANSIREAMYLGVPVVTSDAVERPKATRVFHSRDNDDFESKVREALSSNAVSKTGMGRLDEDDQARIDRYLQLIVNETRR